MADSNPTQEDVLAALQKLSAWPEIARSTQLSRFLDYVVRAKLRGDEAGIKAYSIAVDVFDRPADFDPQSDPIVRVQARRLRGIMAQYYESAGKNDSVRIDLPTGRYVPEFVVVGPDTRLHSVEELPVYPSAPVNDLQVAAPEVVHRRRSRGSIALALWSALAVAACVIGVAAIHFAMQGEDRVVVDVPLSFTEPATVKVMEFQRLSPNDADVVLTAGLAVDVVSKLNSSLLVKSTYGGTSLNQQIDADFVLSGTVRRDQGQAHYVATLTETATGTVRWTKEYRAPVEGRLQLGLTDEVGLRLAAGVSNITGPILAPIRALLAENTHPFAPSLYTCRVIYSGYRAEMLPDGAADSHQCYAQLPPDVRESGETQAALAMLIVDGAQGSGYEGVAMGVRTAIAEEMLRKAIALEPLNSFVWTQFARFSRERGDFANEEMAYGTALTLNPGNAEVLAGYSQSLAIAGRREEGMQLFDIAMGSISNPQAWFYITPAMVALATEDWEALGHYAKILLAADNMTAPLFGVAAGYHLKDEPLLSEARTRLLATQSFRDNGIMPQLARRISDAQLLRVIRDTLLAAGVSTDQLDGPY